MKNLQSVYNQITNILRENNVIMNITPPRPYLIKKEDDEKIKVESKKLLNEGKIDEYNKKMDESEKCKLYFDEAYKYTDFSDGETSNTDDMFQVNYMPDKKKIKINLPKEVWENIDTIIMTEQSKEELTIEKQTKNTAPTLARGNG